MADNTRIERNFHEMMWTTANESSALERAVIEGRDLAYALLEVAKPGSAQEALAEHWLEEFGRDERKERKRG